MENKLKVYPVMLPTKEVDTPIWQGHNSRFHPWIEAGDIRNFCHLHLASDREIKEGDWFIYGDKPTRLDKGTGEVFSKRIEATADKSLGLPLIPKSFIKEWVEKQGKIEYVYIPQAVVMKDAYTLDYIAINCTIVKGERYIDILPTKDSWNREDMKKAWEAGHDEAGKLLGPFETFDKWFDKNY